MVWANIEHNSEIHQEIAKVCKKHFKFIFTPHLTPMFRGILSTIYINAYQIKLMQKKFIII